MSFFLYFKQDWAKLKFFENLSPKKHVLLILLGMALHSKLRLCIQNIVLNANNWIQVQNIDLIESRTTKPCLEWRVVKNTKKFKKRPKIAKIMFWWDHIIKIIGNYVWNKFRNFFGIFWPFLVNFHFLLKYHDFSNFFLENSEKPLFDLWGPLWWVPHVVLALNQWLRPKKRGTKKSVPQTSPI